MDTRLPVGIYLKYFDGGIKFVKDMLAKGEHLFKGSGWNGFSFKPKLTKLAAGQDFPPDIPVWDVNVQDAKFLAEVEGKFFVFKVTKKQGIYIH